MVTPISATRMGIAAASSVPNGEHGIFIHARMRRCRCGLSCFTLSIFSCISQGVEIHLLLQVKLTTTWAGCSRR